MAATASSESLTLRSSEGETGTYDVYLVGLPCGKDQSGGGEAQDSRSRSPLDVLPDLVPEARVFEFALFGTGDASKTRHISADNFSAEAYLLLDAIHDSRSTENEWGSILLVGYGLGGIIIKHALALANSDPKYYDVAIRTSDVVFISTPHTAPSLDDWEDLLIRLISLNRVEVKGRRARFVSELAVLVESVVSQFYGVASRYHITNFFDSAGAALFDRPTSDSFSGNALAEKDFALTEDDLAAALAPTSEKEWELSLRNSLAPSNLLNTDSEPSEDSNSAHIRADFLNCLQLLSPSRWFIYQTNSALLKEESAILEMYHEQIDSLLLEKPTSEPLSIRVTGPQGHGKSTFIKLLAQRLRKQLTKVVVLDAWTNSFSGSAVSTHTVLISLAHQLLCQIPTLFRHVRNFYLDHAREETWTVETLETFVSVLLRHCKTWKVVIPRNNVERWPSDAKELFERLLAFLRSIGTNYVYLSSSENHSDDQFMHSGPSAQEARHVDLGKGAQDSRTKFLESKLDVLVEVQKQGTIAAFKDIILEKLTPFHGSYATASLYVMQLSHRISLSTMEALNKGLNEWPKTGNEIYKLAIADLENKPSHVFDWCEMAVSWALRSQRPLRIQELAAAVAIKEKNFNISAMHSSISVCIEEDIKRHLSIWLRLESQAVYLFSSATRKFLNATYGSAREPEHPEEPGRQLFRVLSHGELARQCLEYLTQLLSNLEELGIEWDNCRAQVTWRYELRQRKHPELDFLSYAATQWPTHYHLAETDNTLDARVLQLLEDEELARKWYELYSLGNSPSLGPAPGHVPVLHVATDLGLTRIVKSSMVDEQTFKPGSPDPDTLLARAIRGGHEDLATLLLGMGASGTDALLQACRNDNAKMIDTLIQRRRSDDDSDSNTLATALNIAAQGGSLEAVTALLEHSSVLAKDFRGRTPLHQAVVGGSSKVIELLLGTEGCDINAQDHDLRTPLVLAAKLGLVSVVRALATTHAESIDVNVPDKDGLRALHFATHDGVEMVGILLDCGACPTALNDKEQSALYTACSLGYLDVAKRLVDALDDETIWIVDKCDGNDKTALEAAAENGHSEIVELLLSCSDKGSVGARTDKAIDAAAAHGHLAIVKRLFPTVNSDAPSPSCQRALYRASASGHVLVVEFLLSQDVRSGGDAEESPIAAAAKNGRLAVVRTLLEHDEDPNVETEDDLTPLHLAVRGGRFKIVDMLLKNGADANALDSERMTPLHFAAEDGRIRIAELLLQNDAFVNARTRNRDSVLHLSVAHPELVQLLLEANVDLDPVDNHGATPLQAAIKGSHKDTAEMLLDRGARLDFVDDEGYTPFHYAIQFGSLAMVKKMWDQNLSLEDEAYKSQPPLTVAAKSRNLDVVRFLLEQDPAAAKAVDSDGGTALHAAADQDQEEAVAVLLGHDPDWDVNKQDNDGMSPLHLGSWNGNVGVISLLLGAGAAVDQEAKDGTIPLHRAVVSGSLEAVILILEAMTKSSASIDKRDTYDRTPLYRGAWAGYVDIVEKLVDSGANLHIPDKDGWTPLHAAADSTSLTTYLIDKGADLNAVDNAGWTPLMRAAYWQRADTAEVLLKAGAQVNIQREDGTTALQAAILEGVPSVVTILIDGGADVSQKNAKGQTALHLAATASYNGATMTEQLIATNSAIVDWKDNEGKTALHVAALHVAYLDKAPETLGMLLRHTSDVNAKDNDGRTALHHAILQDRLGLGLVIQLLEHGASMEERDEQGQGCLDFAARNYWGDVLGSLLEREEKSGTTVWDVQDRTRALWAAYSNLAHPFVEALLKWESERRESKEVANSRSPEGWTLLEAAFLDGRAYTVSNLLDMGLDPFQRRDDESPSAFEMVPMCTTADDKADFFHRFLDRLHTDLSVLGDGFKALRCALEVGSAAGWTKLEPLRKLASKREDQDRWTLDHYIYQAGDAIPASDRLPKAPEKTTSYPTCLRLLRPHGEKERSDSEIEVVGDLEVKYKLDDQVPISVRADHPLPPRDTGRPYFEVEILPSEGDAKGVLVGIGLCSEFDVLRDAWPGFNDGGFGYHGDGCLLENSDTIKRPAEFAGGDTIGCGIDWKNEAFYFTLNGAVVISYKSKVIYRKLYPVITMSDSPGTVRANFGGEEFAYKGNGNVGQ